MRGRTPSVRQKASCASADIPITLLVNTLRTWPRVHLSVCVGRALVELFMTGLIGLIEDIKITCQPCVSSTPSQSDNSWQVRGPHSIRHDGAFPDLNRDNGGCSNMMRTTPATRIGLPWLVRVCYGGLLGQAWPANGVPSTTWQSTEAVCGEKWMGLFKSSGTWEGWS